MLLTFRQTSRAHTHFRDLPAFTNAEDVGRGIVSSRDVEFVARSTLLAVSRTPVSTRPLIPFSDLHESNTSSPHPHPHPDDDDSDSAPSIWSEWSSNYTMSDLPGPGRILGNLYSTAGAALERAIARLTQRKQAKKRAEEWVAASSRRVVVERVARVVVPPESTAREEVVETWWDDAKREWEFREKRDREGVVRETGKDDTTSNWKEEEETFRDDRKSYLDAEEEVSWRSSDEDSTGFVRELRVQKTERAATQDANSTRLVEEAEEVLTSQWQKVSRSNSPLENARICEVLFEYARCVKVLLPHLHELIRNKLKVVCTCYSIKSIRCHNS